MGRWGGLGCGSEAHECALGSRVRPLPRCTSPCKSGTLELVGASSACSQVVSISVEHLLCAWP